MIILKQIGIYVIEKFCATNVIIKIDYRQDVTSPRWEKFGPRTLISRDFNKE